MLLLWNYCIFYFLFVATYLLFNSMRYSYFSNNSMHLMYFESLLKIKVIIHDIFTLQIKGTPRDIQQPFILLARPMDYSYYYQVIVVFFLFRNNVNIIMFSDYYRYLLLQCYRQNYQIMKPVDKIIDDL